MIANLLYYGVPSAVIAVTLWVGFLGWRFYVREVLRDNDTGSEPSRMKIAVIGAGVVGVATAHALAERGHEVHVYDRRSEVASDTSASTAGLIAPGHSYAWASPPRRGCSCGPCSARTPRSG